GRLQRRRRSVGAVPRLLGDGRAHRGGPGRGGRRPRPLRGDLARPRRPRPRRGPAAHARAGGLAVTAGAGSGRPAGRYLLGNDAPEAMDRFTAFATLFDPSTFRHLDELGLAAGWRCWEVGAGGTSVVTFLS